jgi:hypothetical protein
MSPKRQLIDARRSAGIAGVSKNAYTKALVHDRASYLVGTADLGPDHDGQHGL